MTLIDIPISSITITDQANEVREMLACVIGIAEVKLHQIRNLVRTHGRTALAAELGDDAAAMLVVYTKLKEAIEAAKEIEIEDLP